MLPRDRQRGAGGETSVDVLGDLRTRRLVARPGGQIWNNARSLSGGGISAFGLIGRRRNHARAPSMILRGDFVAITLVNFRPDLRKIDEKSALVRSRPP